MNTEELTPLEKLDEARHKHALFRATLFATMDLLEVSNECDIAIASITENSDEMEKRVVEEAKKDIIATDHAIALLAETMEIKFGISA